MDRRGKDGSTLRDHAEQVRKQLGRWPSGIPEEPPFPFALQYLWTWFADLSAGRGGGMGPAPIAWRDIEAWCNLTGVRLARWELGTIRAIDHALIEALTTADGKLLSWQKKAAERAA